MINFEDILMRTFGSAPPPVEPVAPVAPPEPAPPEPEKPKKGGKSVRDPMIAAEAQRIYKPDMPPTPPSRGGVAANMDLEGAWGKPIEVKP